MKIFTVGQGLGSGQEDKLPGVKEGWAGGQAGCAATTLASSAACQAKAVCREWADSGAAPARCLLRAAFSCQFWDCLLNLAANLSEPSPIC